MRYCSLSCLFLAALQIRAEGRLDGGYRGRQGNGVQENKMEGRKDFEWFVGKKTDQGKGYCLTGFPSLAAANKC